VKKDKCNIRPNLTLFLLDECNISPNVSLLFTNIVAEFGRSVFTGWCGCGYSYAGKNRELLLMSVFC
jgi:hypothetical protein